MAYAVFSTDYEYDLGYVIERTPYIQDTGNKLKANLGIFRKKDGSLRTMRFVDLSKTFQKDFSPLRQRGPVRKQILLKEAT